MADGEAGDGVVGEAPEGVAVAAGEEDEGEGGEDEAAVENEAAFGDEEDAVGMGGVVGPVGDDVGGAGADDAGGHQPEAEVGGEAGGAVFVAAEPLPGEDGAEEAEGGHDAVAVDGAAEDVEQDGVHGGRA